MAEEIKKLFSSISDSQMLEETQTILDIYSEDQVAFGAFDASFDAAFLSGGQALIDAAIDFPTDENILNEITELTDTVMAKWEACKIHFQDSKYFIEKAFPGNVARHKVFGFDDYRDMSRVQNKVIQFMDQYSDTAQKYKTELVAAGYTLLKINEIATLSGEFRDANREQEKAKKHRLESTQNRTVAMNAVWAKIKLINAASKSIYRTNYAKLQQYLMPAPASNEPLELLGIIGTIINTVTNLPEVGVNVTLTDLGLVSVSDDAGGFAFAAGLPEEGTAIKATKTGFVAYSSTVTPVEGTTVTKNFQITPA